MWPDPTGEHGITVDVQVLRGDCGGHSGRCRFDKLHCLRGGDVFEHHLERWKVCHYARQHTLDKYRLAVKNVDRRIGHFAVDQQRHADRLHSFERRADIRHVSDAVR